MIQRITISMNAMSGFFNPKNNTDHKKLSISCVPNIINAIFVPFNPEFQIRYIEIPIKIYSAVQTGAKSQFGGLKLGLFNPEYQVGMAFEVKNPPKNPTIKHMAMETISFMIFMLIKVHYTFRYLNYSIIKK
jgi:hypothetical protein